MHVIKHQTHSSYAKPCMWKYRPQLSDKRATIQSGARQAMQNTNRLKSGRSPSETLVLSILCRCATEAMDVFSAQNAEMPRNSGVRLVIVWAIFHPHFRRVNCWIYLIASENYALCLNGSHASVSRVSDWTDTQRNVKPCFHATCKRNIEAQSEHNIVRHCALEPDVAAL